MASSGLEQAITDTRRWTEIFAQEKSEDEEAWDFHNLCSLIGGGFANYMRLEFRHQHAHTHTLKETQRRNKRNLFDVCYWFFFLDLELIFIWIVCQSSETETDDDMAADDLPQDENRVNVFYEQLGKANRERTCRSTSKTPPSRYVFWNRSRIRWVIFRMIFLLLDIT